MTPLEGSSPAMGAGLGAASPAGSSGKSASLRIQLSLIHLLTQLLAWRKRHGSCLAIDHRKVIEI